MGKLMVCLQCGTTGLPKRTPKGSMAIEAILWVVGLLTCGIALPIALIYSIWRLVDREKVCFACGARELVPITSPQGQAAIKSLQKP